MEVLKALIFLALAVSQGDLSAITTTPTTAATAATKGKSPCVCAVSSGNKFNTTLNLSHQLNVAFDCSSKGENDCKLLCIALGDAKIADPNGAEKLCNKLNKDVKFQPYVFSKVCKKDFVFAEKKYPINICCKNSKSVPC